MSPQKEAFIKYARFEEATIGELTVEDELAKVGFVPTKLVAKASAKLEKEIEEELRIEDPE